MGRKSRRAKGSRLPPSGERTTAKRDLPQAPGVNHGRQWQKALRCRLEACATTSRDKRDRTRRPVTCSGTRTRFARIPIPWPTQYTLANLGNSDLQSHFQPVPAALFRPFGFDSAFQ